MVADGNFFEDYRGALLDDFEVRSLYVRNHIWNNFDLDGKVDIEIHIEPTRSGKVHLNTIDIYDPAWEGVYFDGVPVTMTAIPLPDTVLITGATVLYRR